MYLIREELVVKEVIKDFMVDGLLQKYDDSSSIMFSEVVECRPEFYDKLSEKGDVDDLIIVSHRGNKTEFLGNYIINESNVIGVIPREEFNRM